MSYVSTVPYADLAYATSFFGDRLGTIAWDSSTDPLRTKALKQATRAIDNLNFAGHKAVNTWTAGVADQPRQFPRGDDVTVPDAVLQACCELALALLDDVDPNLEIENLRLGRMGIGDAHVLADTSYVQEHVRAGIPSIQAWTLLLPFLRDVQHPRIELHRGG